MITVETLGSELLDIEMATIRCEEHVGVDPCFTVDIERSLLEPAQQTIYDNFMSLMATTNINEISNTTAMLYINRGTSGVITEGVTQIDFTVDLDATQQGYVDAFVQLVVDLRE